MTTAGRGLLPHDPGSRGKADKRQVKGATVGLSHNIGGAPQACGICIVALP